MKKVMLGLTAMTLFFAACKKDDDSPATSYLTKIIEVREDGNDTTFVTYNANNTFKERYSFFPSSGQNSGQVDYGEGPAYESGKIVAIMERTFSNPTPVKGRSFVYTGNNVTRVNYWNTEGGQTSLIAYYDSLVYASGKLAEYFVLNPAQPGVEAKHVLAWEGNNVKTSSFYRKQAGGDFILQNTIKYSYDTKPGFQTLFAGNYNWLSDTFSFEFLSANNLVKEEVYEGDVLRSTVTNAYTYDGNLLKMIDTEDTYIDPASTHTIKLKLEYATK